ncbi:PREDICTED: fos-related antigen 1-like [Nipponia nippon]|uniref:fos-related antigen 1-like n=1 Tax=Nipponia nippon TaxID=128390 RepID=UPI0005111174|nr:PREDICTED: fos-related antigen 1-like [Nipponia nippon]
MGDGGASCFPAALQLNNIPLPLQGPRGSPSSPVPGVARALGPLLWWQSRPSEETGPEQAPACLEVQELALGMVSVGHRGL